VPDEPTTVERDGDVVRIIAGPIEVIARLIRSGDDLILEGLSIDGAGPGPGTAKSACASMTARARTASQASRGAGRYGDHQRGHPDRFVEYCL